MSCAANLHLARSRASNAGFLETSPFRCERITSRSPQRWLIGSIGRECLDHVIILGEAHLRKVLRAYARQYNEIRTHRALQKDAPIHRAIQLTGMINSRPMLSGLRHHYVRI
jgi:hypothetical protein